jgi:hypothetical protein
MSSITSKIKEMYGEVLISIIAVALFIVHYFYESINNVGLVLILLAMLPVILPFLRKHIVSIGKDGAKFREGVKEKLAKHFDLIKNLVAFSMSVHLFKHLQDLYYDRDFIVDNRQYKHKDNLRFLRHLGYIDHNFEIGPLKDGFNLKGHLKLTPAGIEYVKLREEMEKEINAH